MASPKATSCPCWKLLRIAALYAIEKTISGHIPGERRERPRRYTTEQRHELAPFQLCELHALLLASGFLTG
jgi:hypothetical protein